MTVGWFEGADIAFKLQYRLLNSFVDTIGNVLYCVYAKYFDRKWLSLLFLFQLGNPLEPCHIHVRKHGALAKYWIGEKVILADNIGFSAKVFDCTVLLERLSKGYMTETTHTPYL